jgi:Dyp-type peroxidase family
MIETTRRRLGRPSNLPPRVQAVSDMELSDIQGNVLRGYTYPCAAYLFLHIDDVDAGRALLARMLPQVATAEPWPDGEAPATALHVAFTYAGLEALGLSRELLDSFPEAFREGMAARADRLGDRGPSAPEHWEPGLGTGDAHVLVTVYAVDEEHLEMRREELRHVGAAGAITVINESRASALPGGRDHFGFFDGIAQPAIAGTGVSPRPGDGQPDGAGGWREVCPGEFLLGHVDEDGDLPEAPAEPLHRNGTYMVYRKLAMDVAAFRRFVAEQGERYPGGPEKLAAKIVGRWPDGTPLEVSPERPDPEVAGDPTRINDFGYEDDHAGHRCPVGAHIRRANPRDDRNFFGGRLTNRHRIIRRGRAYGLPLAEGTMEDDGVDRGLVFVCFQSDIWRQFETIQALWIDDGDPFGLGADKDFLIGEPNGGGPGKMTIQGDPPHILCPQPRFVTLRGGEYLYRPSMSGLRWLAGVAAAS